MAMKNQVSGIEAVENQNLELDLLLEAIFQKYGYDFRSYSRASIKRRVLGGLARTGLESISKMQHEVIHDPVFFASLINELTVSVTEMFRDPCFFAAVRSKVVPILAQQPFIKLWHAGCASGEEVYSMAIVLSEAGLLDKTRIYATDLNVTMIDRARDGIFPIDKIKTYTSGYQQAGGVESFSQYYTARYDSAVLKSSLKENIVFADHNLTTDACFGEMDMIVCRNVLIYFGRDLQSRVVKLFSQSLAEGGFFCLGAKESLRLVRGDHGFERFGRKERIYRKGASKEQESET